MGSSANPSNKERRFIRSRQILNSIRVGYLKIVCAAVIWGSLGIFVRKIPLSAPAIVSWRILFAAITVLVLILAKGKAKQLRVRGHRGLLLFCGIGLTLNWVLFFYALKLTTIANAVLLTYTAPIFIALFASLFLGEILERATLLSLTLSMLGVALIVSPFGFALGGSYLAGIVCALGSAISYGLLVIASKVLLQHLPILTMMFYEDLIGVLLLSPFLFLSHSEISSTAWVLLVILGVVHTALAAFLYLSGLKDIKAQQAGVLAYFDPLSAIVFALIFLGEVPGILTLIGGLLILLAGFNIAARGRVPRSV
ncbi:MAG TPA: EamA family transporter [Actinobacteria bacterium]|nr:EamA family transporter [Actinomycetota bacterium]